ncbi:hypothetical protein HMPREF3291_24475 [Bacillus sp. HMSC76G11]|uniref:LXG domain-containing protein n=1 Tax=Metabacillus idriensis TaxID=324768 RepID=A0A6I2MET1_9BACI|nr:T7SS effector LXG polymorphic toxin [Metabacillus idriensis]MRX54941.1 hypothetical protein [Metabacillus idriensis]OHR71429.1 hypothetical protein HMPREF3291_24475 [Bacillus sp. HMSC76G11]
MVLNAVYEADSLISAMEKRANDYKNVREQLLVLQKTLDKVAQSHDSFQGEGAEAVQSFYQEEASLVDEWLILIDMQVAFHNGVAADAADSNLAGRTSIHMVFLEHDLANGYRRSKEMVADQQKSLTGILSSISDLVELQPFYAGPYLSFKKEQAKERRIQELQQQLEHPTLSLDEYLKIAESIGNEHLTSDQKEIVRLIKVKKQHGERIKGVSAGLWNFTKDIASGLWNFTKDTASGLWDVLMTPPEQVLWDLGKAVINYEETYAQISAAIASSYERDMVNGNDYTRARWVTYAIATTATSLVGLKGVDKTGKAGFAAGKNAVRETKKAVSSKMNSLNYSSSFPLRYAFAEGFDGVPYNAVKSLGYKEQLEKQVYMFFKSTGKEYKNYKVVDFTGSTKVDGEIRDISRRVFQRIDIDYKRIDPNTGLTNLQLMKKGRAPIWQDGTVIELHHLIQREPGSMVEIPASMHDEYHKILHGLVENGGSFRNNPVLKKQYDNFRSKYWRWRAKQIDNSKL